LSAVGQMQSFEMLNFTKYCDHETWVRGNSTSLEISHSLDNIMTSY